VVSASYFTFTVHKLFTQGDREVEVEVRGRGMAEEKEKKRI